MSAIARRPLTPQFLTESLYLLGVLGTGTLGFAVALTTLSLSLSLLILIVGVPVAAGCAILHRWICDLDRRLVRLVRGRPLRARYAPLPPSDGVWQRSLSVLRDRQTWRDLSYMLVGFLTAVVSGCALALAWGSIGYMTYPLWVWALPDDSTFGAEGAWEAVLIALHVPAGVLFAIVGAWAVHGMTRVEVALASGLLSPLRSAELEQRVEHLSETRAGAVDESTAALERIERDLHDGAQARLVALAMDLGMAEQKLAANQDHETARELVTEAREHAQTAMGELRDLVRGFGPSILHDRGLDAALSELVTRGGSSRVSIAVDLPERPSKQVESAAYFVAAEGIANARKHAGAELIAVRAWTDALDRLVVEVADDGRGGADPAKGSGLGGLAKRVAAIDGTLSVVSPQGGPTVLRAELPLR